MTEPFEAHGDAGRKRNSCKAIIVKGNSILLTVNHDDTGDFYLLPGGGQRFGETLHEALQREVLEETGWIVKPGKLVLSRDYIGANHEFAKWEEDVHQTEMMFLAEPLRQTDGITEPDPWQTGFEWIDAESLKDLRLFPSVLKEILPLIITGKYTGPVYLGDVN
jgi:8-oxo-dGTP diphosphatase